MALFFHIVCLTKIIFKISESATLYHMGGTPIPAWRNKVTWELTVGEGSADSTLGRREIQVQVFTWEII